MGRKWQHSNCQFCLCFRQFPTRFRCFRLSKFAALSRKSSRKRRNDSYFGYHVRDCLKSRFPHLLAAIPTTDCASPPTSSFYLSVLTNAIRYSAHSDSHSAAALYRLSHRSHRWFFWLDTTPLCRGEQTYCIVLLGWWSPGDSAHCDDRSLWELCRNMGWWWRAGFWLKQVLVMARRNVSCPQTRWWWNTRPGCHWLPGVWLEIKVVIIWAR